MRVTVDIRSSFGGSDGWAIVFSHTNQLLVRSIALKYSREHRGDSSNEYNYIYEEDDSFASTVHCYGYLLNGVEKPFFTSDFIDYIHEVCDYSAIPTIATLKCVQNEIADEAFNGETGEFINALLTVSSWDDWGRARGLIRTVSNDGVVSNDDVVFTTAQITRPNSLRMWVDALGEAVRDRDTRPNTVKDDITSHSCTHCWSGATHKVGEYYYCDDCYDSRVIKCAICGEEHLVDKQNSKATKYHIFNGRPVCEKCMKEYCKRYKKSVYFCAVCGEFHSIDFYGKHRVNENEWCCDYGKTQCQKCHCCEMLVYFNGNQNSYMHTSFNRNAYCHKCWLKKEKYLIKAYHNDPKPEFYIKDGDKNTMLEFSPPNGYGEFYGLELEVDSGGQSDDVSEPTIKMLNEEVYAMRDGSLENGFEIVTHPHSEDALYNMAWEDTFKFLVSKGYRSHDISTCGLHLHINRSVFGKNSDEQRYNIAKLLYFFENNQVEFVKLSRREVQHINRWARFYFTSATVGNCSVNNYLRIYDDFNRSRNHDDRYKAINLCKKNTIEFRLMRGTLNIETFLATLDVLITISKNAKKIPLSVLMLKNTESQKRILNPAFWLKGIKGETMKYLKENNIFVDAVKKLEGGEV